MEKQTLLAWADFEAMSDRAKELGTLYFIAQDYRNAHKYHMIAIRLLIAMSKPEILRRK